MEYCALLTGIARSEAGVSFDWSAAESGPLARFAAVMKRTDAESDGPPAEDVWTHAIRTCERLAEHPDFARLTVRRQDELLLAALLHDVGATRITRAADGSVNAPYHAPDGARIARAFLWERCGIAGTPEAQNFRETVCALIRWHNVAAFATGDAECAARFRHLAEIGVLAPDFTLSLLCLLTETDRGPEGMRGVRLTRGIAARGGFLDAPPALPVPPEAWGEVLMMCGLPGTGKDTWLRANYPDLPWVCLDDIRAETNISPTADQSAVVALAFDRAEALLRARTPFVWNATCISPRSRRDEIALFRAHGAAVRIVWLETGWEEELARNRGRSRVVPESAIRRMLGNFEPPFPYEADRVDWLCI